MSTQDTTAPAVDQQRLVRHRPQYGDVPAFYLFEHEGGVFDVRGMGCELPADWLSLSDAERLEIAAREYRPMSWDEMMHNSIEWSRRQVLKMANVEASRREPRQ